MTFGPRAPKVSKVFFLRLSLVPWSCLVILGGVCFSKRPLLSRVAPVSRPKKALFSFFRKRSSDTAHFIFYTVSSSNSVRKKPPEDRFSMCFRT